MLSFLLVFSELSISYQQFIVYNLAEKQRNQQNILLAWAFITLGMGLVQTLLQYWCYTLLGIGECPRAMFRTSNAGHGAWSSTKRATCPTDFGPIGGLPLNGERGQITIRSAFHSAAQLTISRSGRPCRCNFSAPGR